MNFNILKTGFIEYLEKINASKDVEEKYETENIQKSIFLYTDEFEEYIKTLELTDKDLVQDIEELTSSEVITELLAEINATEEELSNIDTTEEIPVDDEIDEDQAQENEDESMVLGIISDLFQDEEFKALVDENENGTIEEEELLNLLNTIKSNDENEENLSVEDIVATGKEFNETGKLNLDTKENTPEEKIQETQAPNNTNLNQVHGGPNNSPTNTTHNNTTNNKKELSLEDQKTEKQKEILAATQEANEIRSGNHEEIKTAEAEGQAKIDEAQATIDEIVERNKENLEAFEEKRQAKETEIKAKEEEITNTQNAITLADKGIELCKGEISIKESSLSALKNSQITLASQENSADKNEKSRISQKLDEISKQISAVEAEINKLKTELEKAEKEKQTQEEILETKKTELQTLKDEKANIENDMINAIEGEDKANLEAAFKAQEEATTASKENVETIKNRLLNGTETKIATLESELKAIEDKIKTEEQQKAERLTKLDASQAVEWAREYDDKSQSEMAGVFSQKGYDFHTGLWCADFVRMALGEGVGDENLPDWYRNINNKAYCPNIQAAGKDYKISAEEAQMGDIVLFDWDHDGSADHVGLFVDNGDGSSTITAIEGNTSNSTINSGSAVEEKERDRNNVLGIYTMTA